MRNHLVLAAVALVSSTVPAVASAAATNVSGNGALSTDPRRNFSISARIADDGTVSGRATVINKAFSGDSGKGPYLLQVDISCAKVLDDKTVIFGGTTRKTNDSNLVDAVYFAVQDNGEPGGNTDKVSRAYFFDDDPTTTGDPALCQQTTLAETPLETIVTGNINVRN